MALAVVGETCSITFDGSDHRCYQFDITKSGDRVNVKAFVDPIGSSPEIITNTTKEIVCKFYDDVTETFEVNSDYTITYTILSTAVTGVYNCLEVQNTTPANGIADFTASFRYNVLSVAP